MLQQLQVSSSNASNADSTRAHDATMARNARPAATVFSATGADASRGAARAYRGRMDKRTFLRTVAGAATSALATGCTAGASRAPDAPDAPVPAAPPPDFWQQLRARYHLPSDRIDLEHGFYSRMADDVLEAFVAHVRAVNVDAAFYMRTRQEADKRRARERLAELAGCPPEELIITRNTTESLDTVIAGLDWRPGDEAVMAHQDYRAMQEMFAQVARRHGTRNRLVSLPHDPPDDDRLVDLYAAAITDRTRLLMVPHVVNITGQVLPVAKIAAMARARGVPVLVDGAHAFAQLDFRIPDLGCDYYGASLHKWLGSPLGAGILWVRKDRIPGVWPLFGDPAPATAIERLNHTGTHPAATDLAIVDAIAHLREIGLARKQERLRWLQRYWTQQVCLLPRVRLFTPSAAERTCAIATFGIDGREPSAIARELHERFRIYTVAIHRPEADVVGVRVTPHLYTTTAELDALVAAIRTLAG